MPGFGIEIENIVRGNDIELAVQPRYDVLVLDEDLIGVTLEFAHPGEFRVRPAEAAVAALVRSCDDSLEQHVSPGYFDERLDGVAPLLAGLAHRATELDGFGEGARDGAALHLGARHGVHRDGGAPTAAHGHTAREVLRPVVVHAFDDHLVAPARDQGGWGRGDPDQPRNLLLDLRASPHRQTGVHQRESHLGGQEKSGDGGAR